MGEDKSSPISLELGGGAIVAIVLAVGDLTWITRGIFVLAAFALVWHLSWRMRRHVVLRFACGAAGTLLIFAFTWEPIWAAMKTAHPSWVSESRINGEIKAATEIATAVAAALNQFWVLALLGIIVLITLGWLWTPFRRLRRTLLWSWRRTLGEEVWIDQEMARQLLADSEWGKLKRPSQSFAELLNVPAVSGSPTTFQKNMVIYKNFLQMTLDSFEEYNPHFVRINEGKKEYLMDKLKSFTAAALDKVTVDKYGAVPTFTVD